MDDVQIEVPDSNESEQRGMFARAIELNTDTLSQLICEIRSLRQTAVGAPSAHADPNTHAHSDKFAEAERRLEASERENERLRAECDELRGELQDLREQNEDLARRVASTQVRQSLAATDSSSADALSWEDRKAMILQQMENDSFDAESFISEIKADPARPTQQLQPGEGGEGSPIAIDDPIAYVRQLHQQLDRHESEINRRDQEIGELRCLLEQKPAADTGVAFGAAAIAEMIDSDELVREEREKLLRLQEEWEEKFRQGEVAASLERAKLSRERQELAFKAAELEEQLEQLRKVNQDLQADGKTPSRRWLAALGIHESES